MQHFLYTRSILHSNLWRTGATVVSAAHMQGGQGCGP